MHIGSILLVVALVPLTGTAILTWSSLADARSVASAADEIEAAATRTADLIELGGAVFDELAWTSIVATGEEIGAPPGVLAALVGSDPVEARRSATAATDLIATRVRDAELDAILTAARSDDIDLYTMLRTYGRARDRVDELLASSIDALRSASSGSVAGSELADAARNLELATTVRGAVGDGFFTYFATLFDIHDSPAEEVARLVRIRASDDDALAELAAEATVDGTPVVELETVIESPTLAAFNAALDDLITTSLAEGVPDDGAPLTIDILTSNVAAMTAVYTAGIESSVTTAELIDSATAAVLTGADSARDDADRMIRRAGLLAALLTMAAGAAAIIARRAIVRPLRELRRSADGLRGDGETVVVEQTGPAEVRAAAAAIGDAATHFDLVTHQARALASGDLHAEVLGEAAPGGIGSALQDAVGTLRSALARQDEFRRRLAHEAAHDGLTKLANRSASMAQLGRALARIERSDSQLAVLFIDLDRFKDVNDHHGHQAGDTVLTSVAHRLVEEVREGDHVGRLGGDEFVVVAEPVDGIEDAVALARRILTALERPIELSSGSVGIGASIGVAIAPGASLTADELLRDADLAAYRAKEMGRGGVQVCDEELREEMAQTADLTVALRRAIDEDELVLHYQPIVDTGGRRVGALEALVRWRRADGDLAQPVEFIDFAERSSLIVDLDRWVVDRAVRQIASWHAEGRFLGTPVAVNISGRHLAHHDVVRHVLDPLDEHGVEPRSLIVEVTESALLDDLPHVASKLQELRDAGVAVSIDDFGTGYTSLAHLRSLPVDILKIDRSFTANTIDDESEASIVKLIIDTGHLMGAAITAEGIETAAEADALAGLGSDSLQGFYFAHPRAPEDLAADLGTHVR